MSWRIVVIANRAKLDLRLNYMVVRGETTKKIHLGEISILLIESTEVSLTAALLAELVRQKIKVIFCDEKRNPCSELLGYYGCHDTSSKIRQQLSWQKDNKGNVWTAIVREKIKNQKLLLVAQEKQEAVLLERYLEQLEFIDITNREGHAAKVYFNSLFGTSFTRADDSTINAALNYGYTVLLAACNREIVANGYITQLGLFHDNIFNLFNLGSDLMEPLRPFMDQKIFTLWQKGELVNFANVEKLAILDVLNQVVVVDGKQQVLNYGLKIYCKSIFEALNAEDISLIKWCKFAIKEKGYEL